MDVTLGARIGGRRSWPYGTGRAAVVTIITLGCLAYLAANAQLPVLVDRFGTARYDVLTLALAASFLTLVCKAARWRALYPATCRPGRWLALSALAVGQVANWAIPLRAGDAARLGLVLRSTSPATGSGGVGRELGTGVGILVVEKGLDGAMLLATAGLVVLIAGAPGWMALFGAALITSGCLVLIAGAVLLSKRPASHLITWGPGLGVIRVLSRRLPWAASLLASLGEGMAAWSGRSSAYQVCAWSVATWALGAVANLLVLIGLGLEPDLGAALAVLVALYGAAVLPSIPGRLGVFQYVCVTVLGSFGVTFDRGLAFSLALYGVVYVPPIMIGLCSILVAMRRRGVARSEPV